MVVNGAQLIQIATEYGLINNPFPLDSLVVAPGERAEILIDFSKCAGTKLVWSRMWQGREGRPNLTRNLFLPG